MQLWIALNSWRSLHLSNVIFSLILACFFPSLLDFCYSECQPSTHPHIFQIEYGQFQSTGEKNQHRLLSLQGILKFQLTSLQLNLFLISMNSQHLPGARISLDIMLKSVHVILFIYIDTVKHIVIRDNKDTTTTTNYE